MQGCATDDEQQYSSHDSVMRPRGALPAFGEHGCLAAFQCRVRARKRASRGHQNCLCCRSAISGTNAASSACAGALQAESLELDASRPRTILRRADSCQRRGETRNSTVHSLKTRNPASQLRNESDWSHTEQVLFLSRARSSSVNAVRRGGVRTPALK